MLDAYIYDGLRSPFGKFAGALSSVRPDDLLAKVIRPLVDRSPFPPDAYDDVIIGCANQAGEDSRCVARHALLVAGMPVETPGTVIQRNCGSGLGAIAAAAHAITSGEAGVVLAGGVESMSRAPFVMGKAEKPFQRTVEFYDTSIGARFLNPIVKKLYGDDSNIGTADNLAADFKLSRADCDEFALRSQRLYEQARGRGVFKDELVDIELPLRRNVEQVLVTRDEPPRPDTSLTALEKLKPIYPEGVTTAGNAPPLSDGAAVLTIGSLEAGETAGIAPLARIVGTAVAGVPPRIMGYGPVPASRKLLGRLNLSISDMDVIEINEAFAAQVLACLRDLDISSTDDRLNPNGGAIAIGHPLGASGPRIVLSAVNELERRNGRYALISMCIGVGQGISMVIERMRP